MDRRIVFRGLAAGWILRFCGRVVYQILYFFHWYANVLTEFDKGEVLMWLLVESFSRRIIELAGILCTPTSNDHNVLWIYANSA